MVCVGQTDSKEQAASVRDRVMALAAQIDDSDDGLIDQQEILTALQALGYSVTPQSCMISPSLSDSRCHCCSLRHSCCLSRSCSYIINKYSLTIALALLTRSDSAYGGQPQEADDIAAASCGEDGMSTSDFIDIFTTIAERCALFLSFFLSLPLFPSLLALSQNGM